MKKTILITGAGHGFAKTTAFILAEKGHNVIATAEIWPQVSELKAEVKAKNLTNLVIEKLDVTKQRERDYLIEKYDIDILFSNAGLMEAGPIGEQPVDLIRTMFDINVFSALEFAQGFIKKMVAKKAGKIVFTSSMGGLLTVPYASAYCATKHALEAIAEGLKTELEPFNIKIATVNPGAFDTGFNDRGMDSIRHWYDPKTNFTSEQIFAGFEEMLSQQFDPQMMVDVIVDVILSENPNFRNVCPQPVEDYIKQLQADAWTLKS
jgi:short-subunit dehydrogenase